MKVARYRSITQCIEEIKNVDKDSAISEWFLRSLCKNNTIAYIPSGNKILINFDSLLCYLNGGVNYEEE